MRAHILPMLALLLGALLLPPAASAAVDACAASLCLVAEDESWGSGSCEGATPGSGYHRARRVTVAWSDGASTTSANAYQRCGAVNHPGGEGSYRSTSVVLRRTSWDPYESGSVGVVWSEHGLDGSSDCRVLLLVDDEHAFTEPLPCPGGRAPPVLP